jgi:hypothetical protein
MQATKLMVCQLTGENAYFSRTAWSLELNTEALNAFIDEKQIDIGWWQLLIHK